jgi:hypothetical protein
MGGKENLGRDLDFFVLLERNSFFSPGQEEGKGSREKLRGYVGGLYGKEALFVLDWCSGKTFNKLIPSWRNVLHLAGNLSYNYIECKTHSMNVG